MAQKLLETDFKETFAERLKAARKMRDLTMDQLSELTGGAVSKPNISKYEKAKMMPSSAAHIALAKALQLDFDYFFRPFTAELTKVEFRKLKKLTKHEEDKIVETVRDIAERYAELETLTSRSTSFVNPASDIMVEGQDDVEKVAQRIRDAWGLGNGVLVNVVNMLEEHGLKVVELDAPDAFDGMHATINGKETIIVVNRHYSVERIRFNAMHELGHEVLSFAPSVDEESREKLCHYFASEMLLPGNILKKMVPARVTINDIAVLRSIQTQFGISVEAIWHKLRDLGMLSQSEFKNLCVKMNIKPWLKKIVRDTSYQGDERCYRLERTLMEATSKQLITEEKAKEIFTTLIINNKLTVHAKNGN